MSNQSPNPQPERSFYEFLRRLLYQNLNNGDNTGLIAYVATLDFFALIFTTFMTLAVVKAINPYPTNNPSITNTQGDSIQTK